MVSSPSQILRVPPVPVAVHVSSLDWILGIVRATGARLEIYKLIPACDTSNWYQQYLSCNDDHTQEDRRSVQLILLFQVLVSAEVSSMTALSDGYTPYLLYHAHEG
jgi:hypothetical protein